MQCANVKCRWVEGLNPPVLGGRFSFAEVRPELWIDTYPALNPRDPPGYGVRCTCIRICISWIEWPSLLGSRRDFLKIHSMGLPENIKRFPQNGKKFVAAQKTEISISADGDFGEMKKTETPSKRLRVGRWLLFLFSVRPKPRDLVCRYGTSRGLWRTERAPNAWADRE